MKVIILAAGKGSRLNSETAQIPKAMRLANGKPLISYVLDTVDFAAKNDTIIVVGYLKDKIVDAFSEYLFAEQTELKGTGHAVQSAGELLRGYDGPTLILCGDTPTLKKSTIQKLIASHEEMSADCSVLTCKIERDMKLGRVLRNEDGSYKGILENKDCMPEQRSINEYNTAVYIFDNQKMLAGLEKIKNNNASNEYYLTDLPAILMSDDGKINVQMIAEPSEILGVNTEEDLAEVEAILKSN